MATNYQRLLELRVEHDYYEGRCTDLLVSPTPGSARDLERLRLRARALADGVEIIAPRDGEGAPLVSIPDTLRLRFELRIVEPRFCEVTDLRAWSEHDHPLIRVTREGSMTFVEGSRLPHDVFAELELPELGGAGEVEDTPQRFTLRLAAPSMRWAYYVVTRGEHGRKTPPTIVDIDPARASEPLQFEPADQGDPLDPVGTLLGRLPESRWIRLVSKTPLSARARPRRHLSLRIGKRELLAELPNPSPKRLTQLALRPNEPPQVVSYHVVRL